MIESLIFTGKVQLKVTSHRISALFLAFILSACAAAPSKVALKPEARNAVKHIALIDVPEPTQYTMNPGPLPGGPALYMFGALGGAILGGIEAKRFNTATEKFNNAISPYHPNITGTLLSQIENGLKQKGYDVVHIPQPPKSSDGKDYDLTKISGNFDAVLITTLGAGYAIESGRCNPSLSVNVSLSEQSSKKTLFSDSYSYSVNKSGNSIHIMPDSKFIIANENELYANIPVAVEGLKDGVTKIADRIVMDL